MIFTTEQWHSEQIYLNYVHRVFLVYYYLTHQVFLPRSALGLPGLYSHAHHWILMLYLTLLFWSVCAFVHVCWVKAFSDRLAVDCKLILKKLIIIGLKSYELWCLVQNKDTVSWFNSTSMHCVVLLFEIVWAVHNFLLCDTILPLAWCLSVTSQSSTKTVNIASHKQQHMVAQGI